MLTFFIAGLLFICALSTSITWERTPHPVRRPAFSSHLLQQLSVNQKRRVGTLSARGSYSASRTPPWPASGWGCPSSPQISWLPSCAFLPGKRHSIPTSDVCFLRYSRYENDLHIAASGTPQHPHPGANPSSDYRDRGFLVLLAVLSHSCCEYCRLRRSAPATARACHGCLH
jgi:hypothetical protein